MLHNSRKVSQLITLFLILVMLLQLKSNKYVALTFEGVFQTSDNLMKVGPSYISHFAVLWYGPNK